MSYKPHTNPVRSELLENSLVLDGVSTNEPSQASLVAQLVKKSACYAGDPGSIPGSGRSPGGGHGNPLQYSCLETPHGQRSLVSYSLWGHKEPDMTERLSARARTHTHVLVSRYEKSKTSSSCEMQGLGVSQFLSLSKCLILYRR